MFSLIVIVSLGLFPQYATAQLQVSGGLSPEQLVKDVFAGGGTTITNVTYKGAPRALGSFTAVATNLGVHSGPQSSTSTGGVFSLSCAVRSSSGIEMIAL